MSDQLLLTAETGREEGTRSSRRLRREGRIHLDRGRQLGNLLSRGALVIGHGRWAARLIDARSALIRPGQFDQTGLGPQVIAADGDIVDLPRR